ncbi:MULTISPECIES: siderophore-interacting protein [Microbacterium]|uniref:siderophore-interacting protein n=1 Tax=Microbacterium TaxID=33882 RepID=UPI00217DA855|nr:MULTISPECIES: siderophore-interacting protein [Microbacterium]UWF78256.1 SIP domain-containing protein [Microbacterium neungamense]WCM56428.1 SIP domain-containing protein [Microbacterium sp. EF45047]
MTTADIRTTVRAARRASRGPRVQHLITADEHSLAELEALLATLPLCAVGRVFIEVPDVEDISVVTAPSRMTVTWLPRARRSGAPGTGRRCAQGQAVARAATAWADEMLCEDGDSGLRTEVTLLGGYLGTMDILEHLTEVIGVDAAAIHVPERYGLRTR